ncbi:MAG: phosphoadenylyl-sulfate reductase [Rikenellaceae bacterium]|nr:phosphoadenylyl-sulfate reductase [Rikenellaceae bacterium]
MKKQDYVDTLNERFADVAPETVLKYFLEAFGDKIALSSSLSMEDQVLTDMICKIKPDARIFTLDTGRLFPEAYRLIEQTDRKYDTRIEVFFPDCARVQEMVSRSGINLFYDSVEKRKRCCEVRKLEPLRRAFAGLDVWICGLRSRQSVTRTAMQLIELDTATDLIKLSPLIDWTEEQVREYIALHGVPYNKMHDNGYPSIGCEPCTRAVEPGEDIRAGRWWWESPEHKECGLHRRR